jgi:hypothetical protein
MFSSADFQEATYELGIKIIKKEKVNKRINNFRDSLGYNSYFDRIFIL